MNRTVKILLKVVAVDPRNTSQKCSKCDFVDRHNRKSQSRFVCQDCGYELNADLNASKNIRLKYLAQSGKSSLSAPPVNRRIAAC